MTERQGSFELESQVAAVEWRVSHKGHPRMLAFADRHYTRQTKGSNQFCRPGKNLVLLLSDGSAGWVTWRPLPEVGRSDNLEAWECTLFRNEGETRSSVLVEQATAMVFREWGWPPRDGFITAIGIEQTKRRRGKTSAPGTCYLAAGWLPFTHPNHAQNIDRQWMRAPHPKRTPRIHDEA